MSDSNYYDTELVPVYMLRQDWARVMLEMRSLATTADHDEEYALADQARAIYHAVGVVFGE